MENAKLKTNKVSFTGAEKAVIIEALNYWAAAFESQIKEAEAQGRYLFFAQGWPTGQAEDIIHELQK